MKQYVTFTEMVEKEGQAAILKVYNAHLRQVDNAKINARRQREKMKLGLQLLSQAAKDPALAEKLGLGTRSAVQ